MNVNVFDWERLDRYVAGEGTPEERAALADWVNGSAHLQTIVQVMRTAQRVPDQPAAPRHTQQSWQHVSERLGIAHDGARDPAGAAPRQRVHNDAPRAVLTLPVERGWSWRRFAVGAALIAASVVAVLGAQRWIDNELAQRPGASVSGREYVAPRGQRMIVYLPDRTQISLAPDTRVRLSPRYGQTSRDVELEGQAYFVVTHDPARPFSVRTKGMIARDLGTRFSVRAYPDDAAPEVVVAEGIVALGRVSSSMETVSDSLLLEAGDVGRITRAGDLVRTRGIAVEGLLAWTNGELVFRRTPLRDVVVELSRWYDVEIQLADSALASEQVTASFKDEPASAAIGLVATAAGVVVKQTGSRYTLQRSSR